MPQKTIQQPSVTSLEILDPDGNVDESLDPKLEPERLLAIHRAMELARAVDQRMIKLQRQGRLGTFGPATGQEACSVGPAFAMAEEDWFVGAFREPGGRFVRGEPLVNALIYNRGYEEGNVQPEKARRVLPLNIIVGSQLLHAVGIAYAMKYRGESAAVVGFVGDGGTSQGDFHEALNLAAVWQAPVVFLVANNQWAISTPRAQQTRSKTIAQKAIAYGMPGIQVDGNDVLAVYRATAEALARARAGEGPTQIEAITYRLTMHTTSHDPKKYRSEEEVESWWPKEPLIRFRKYLEGRGLWDQRKQAALDDEIKAEVDAAVKAMEAESSYPPDRPFDHVYGTEHPYIEEQRQQFLAALESENQDG